MRRAALLFASALLGACASVPRQAALHPSVTPSPSGELWVFVGSEDGLPPSVEAKQQLLAAWSSAASASCDGPFVGNPYIQITSFAQPGQPFADPFASGTRTKFTAALGSARCTSLWASAVAQ
jgi:hypothetical protein